MSARPTLWLLDSHYQIFRAYHAMPDLRAPDGTPTGAVRGYASQLVKLLTRERPTHVAAAWDLELTSFRNEIHPGYKASRGEPPADLAPQFALCDEVTRALGVPVIGIERFEADDVIATMTAHALDDGADVFIQHGPIPSAGMGGMTMGFKAPAGGLPADVKTGTPVDFAFTITPQGEFALSSIAPAPPGARQ